MEQMETYSILLRGESASLEVVQVRLAPPQSYFKLADFTVKTAKYPV